MSRADQIHGRASHRDDLADFSHRLLPPEHGWTFYLTWRPDLMRFARPTQEWLPIDPFYREFPLDGPRVIAIDVPITYGAKPFNGVELSGWGTHDKIGARPASQWDWPIGSDARSAPPIVDEVAGQQTARDMLAYRDELIAAVDWHLRAGLTLMREHPWDLFFLGFGSLHRCGHKIWNHRGIAEHSDRAAEADLDDAMRQVAIATTARSDGSWRGRARDADRDVLAARHGRELLDL